MTVKTGEVTARADFQAHDRGLQRRVMYADGTMVQRLKSVPGVWRTGRRDKI